MTKKIILLSITFLLITGCTSNDIPINKVYSNEIIEVGVIDKVHTPEETNLITENK